MSFDNYGSDFIGVVPPIFKYENASELNPRLYDIISRFESFPVIGPNGESGGSKSAEVNLHKKGIGEINVLLSWINELIPKVAHYYSIPEHIPFDKEDYIDVIDHGGGKYNFNIDSFKLVHCWSVLYNKGDGVEIHNHFPYAISFAYYVNTPKGSSSIIIEGEEIKPESGEVIFFPGNAFHSVPLNNVNGRCVIVGNVMYENILDEY
jgi:hypothetical protein